jgi:tRNA pseudouridine32 synthase/23S rRNA pseudouridine746 synthase
MNVNFPPVPILYIDDILMVIDKPAGLPSLPDGYDPAAPHVRSLLEPQFGRAWIVHRLDRGTSGVLLLARTAEAHRALNTQFDHRRVSKVYHALVNGSPEWETKTVDFPLRVDVGHRHRTVVDPARGKPAITHLRVLERFAGYALVEALPETGRTHQIRAHLAAVGHPLLADELYGASPAGGNPPAMSRLALHAIRLTIKHPLQHTLLHFEAPYPEDFVRALDELRQAGRLDCQSGPQ